MGYQAEQRDNGYGSGERNPHNQAAIVRMERRSMRSRHGENNPFYGKQHTEETRRKMSAAAKHRRDRERSSAVGCRQLVVAIIHRAIKDKDAEFFNTALGRDYCDIAGINPDRIILKK